MKLTVAAFESDRRPSFRRGRGVRLRAEPPDGVDVGVRRPLRLLRLAPLSTGFERRVDALRFRSGLALGDVLEKECVQRPDGAM